MTQHWKNDAAIRGAIGAHSMIIGRESRAVIWSADITALLYELMKWCGNHSIDFDVCLSDAQIEFEHEDQT